MNLPLSVCEECQEKLLSTWELQHGICNYCWSEYKLDEKEKRNL